MSDLILMLEVDQWILVFLVGFAAGVVKGIVGFAMPTVMISGLGLIVAPELALAGLIIPTVFSNIFQALRQGWSAAVQSIIQFRRFFLIGLLFLFMSAQLVTALPTHVFLGSLGCVVVAFCILMLSGWQIPVRQGSYRVEWSMGALAGFIGGMSGIWGPATVAFLSTLDISKQDQIRAQGVIYALATVGMVAAHMLSGILTIKAALFSVTLVLPALAGMVLGTFIQDRINHATFKRATLVVLLISGLNLIRRAVMG